MPLSRLIRAACCALLALALGACGSGRTVDISAANQQLDRLALPAGVDAELWAELKRELARVLQENAGRIAAQAPRTDASAPALSLDEGSLTLNWDHACQGDYDQNGEVNVADLTPIAQHFLETSGGGPFPRDSVQSVIDGDGNGEINIADLSPIGSNFQARVGSYEVVASLTITDFPTENAGGDGATAETRAIIPFSAAEGNRAVERLRFRFVLPVVQNGWFYWVRSQDVNDFTEGTPSNLVSFGGQGGNLPPIASFTAVPEIGDVPLTVDFDASASSDADGAAGDITDIVTFQWDFESDGFVDKTSDEPTTQFTYLSAGTFIVTLTVFDAGAATGEATFAVKPTDGGGGGNQPPNAVIAPINATGDAPLTVNFDFSGSSDPDGGFFALVLDIDGDGDGDLKVSPDEPLTLTFGTSGVFNVELTAEDPEGATDSAVCVVTVSGGFTTSVVAETGDTLVRDIALAPNSLNSLDPRINVAFTDENKTMQFVSSTDDTGTAWEIPVDISDSASDLLNEGVHLGILDRPVVAYIDNGGDLGLKFKRAANDSGSVWQEIDIMLEEGTRLSSPSLRIVDGLPGVAYFFNNNSVDDEVHFVRSQTPSGNSAWDPHLVVEEFDGENFETRKVQLLFSGDTPAVVHPIGDGALSGEKADNDQGSDWDGGSRSLFLVQCTGFSFDTTTGDESTGGGVFHNVTQAGARNLFSVHETNAFGIGGGNWNPFVLVDPSIDISNNLEFRRLGSKGVLAFHDNAGRQIKFALSLNASGEEYETPQSLAFGIDSDVFDCTVLDGKVVIVYYDEADKRIEAVSGL
jgi:PKD repeat protein